jgi:hypothetical protein
MRSVQCSHTITSKRRFEIPYRRSPRHFKVVDLELSNGWNRCEKVLEYINLWPVNLQLVAIEALVMTSVEIRYVEIAIRVYVDNRSE